MRETRLPRRVGLDSHILAVLLDGMDELEQFSEEIRAIKRRNYCPLIGDIFPATFANQIVGVPLKPSTPSRTTANAIGGITKIGCDEREISFDRDTDTTGVRDKRT